MTSGALRGLVISSQRRPAVSVEYILWACVGLLFPAVLPAGDPDPVNAWVFEPDSISGSNVRASSGGLDGTIVGSVRVESNPPSIVLDGNEARVVIEEWRAFYTRVHPHSRLGFQSPDDFARTMAQLEPVPGT